MKDFVYLNNNEMDAIVKQSFFMSKNYIPLIIPDFMSMLEKYHSCNINPENSSNDTMRQIETNMRNKYIHHWQHKIEHSTKLEFHRIFKNEYPSSNYLTHLRNFPDSRNLVKFKISQA